MNVLEIKTADGFARKTTFVVAPNLEQIAPAADKKLDLDHINALVGRKYRLSMIQREMASRGPTTEYWAKSRVYVTVPNGVLGGHPAYSVRGEDPANDKAWDAYNRMELAVMRTMVRAFLPLIEATTLGESDPEIHFSRRAGCSCPCSPGFILGGRDSGFRRYGGQPVDFWLEEV